MNMKQVWVGCLVGVCAVMAFAAPVKVELVSDAWTGHCKTIKLEGQKGWQSERWKSLNSRYFFFDVKNPAFKNGNATELEIVLSYFDTFTAPITLQYDSTDQSIKHKDGDGAWKRGFTYNSTGQGGLKTVSWIVPDAMFANRCGKHDFRIAIGKNVDFFIKEVTFRTLGDSGDPAPVLNDIKKPQGFFIPEVFSSAMVLQRDVPIPVWGTAPTGTVVTVSFNGDKLESTSRDGTWRVILPPIPVSAEPRTMTVVANHQSEIINRQFTNVLIGDVWLASGQSNMEMQLGAAEGGQEAIAKSSNPQFRFFTVNRKLETEMPPLGDSWQISSPETAPNMSAVAYFFGCEIQQTQDIPVGIINCSYGGTVTETWCSPDVLKQGWPDWEPFESKMLQNPEWPRKNTSSKLYTRMLKTVIPFPVKGFLWYQGEGNAGRAEEQKKLFPAMVKDWRKSWGDETLPFYIVQLARYEAATWHEFRCAQLDVWKNTPDTFMAVTIDLSKDWNKNNHPIHPTTKAPIGHRLALAARANVYGETDLVYSGPVIRSIEAQDGAAVLSFDHIGSGLIASDNQPLRGFCLSADGETFVEADANINGDNVYVSSSNVLNPVAVRYGAEVNMSKETLDINLANKEQLPASPFTVHVSR